MQALIATARPPRFQQSPILRPTLTVYSRVSSSACSVHRSYKISRNISYMDTLSSHDGSSNVPEAEITGKFKASKRVVNVDERGEENAFASYFCAYTFNPVVVNPCRLHTWHCNEHSPPHSSLVSSFTVSKVASDDIACTFDGTFETCVVPRYSSLRKLYRYTCYSFVQRLLLLIVPKRTAFYLHNNASKQEYTIA